MIEETDVWHDECWKMIKERYDSHFIFLTKRIERFAECVPDDWNDGYENFTVGCTVETQSNADYRLSIFNKLPIKHKNIICQPMIEKINLEQYLNDDELVVLAIRKQCEFANVHFEFRQCGTYFIKDGKIHLKRTRVM